MDHRHHHLDAGGPETPTSAFCLPASVSHRLIGPLFLLSKDMFCCDPGTEIPPKV